MRRNPVFSHDELICKLIMQPDQLELCLLNSTMEDAKRMVKEETKLRSALNEVVCVFSEWVFVCMEEREVHMFVPECASNNGWGFDRVVGWAIGRTYRILTGMTSHTIYLTAIMFQRNINVKLAKMTIFT
jgi:hypothetical protein